MSGTVSTRWFFSDWLSDPGIRTSSLAARGLWKDLLCYAAANRGRDYGFVKIGGRAPSNATLARLLGSTEEEIAKLIAELELNGVFSRDRVGNMYCRRMVRAQKNRKNGKLGGNPNLLNPNNTGNSDNHPPEDIPDPEPKPEPKEEGSQPPAAPSAEQVKLSLQVVPPVYALDLGGGVRLTGVDLAQWEAAFVNIGVVGEMHAMGDWLRRAKAEGKNWFVLAANALAKRNREARLAREARIEVEKLRVNDRPKRTHVD